VAAAILCGLACVPVAQAQDAGDADADPTLVIMRKVEPRIAYRGVPLEDHPIAAQAVMFPGRVFAGAIDSLVDSLVGDSALGEYGAAGPATGVMMPLLERSTSPLGATLTRHAGGNTPLGASATAAGSIGGATRALAPVITGALTPAVDAARQGGGP
jgi:hypothetical protein